MIVRMRVVLKRTVVDDSDLCFGNLSRSQYQSQVKSCLSVKCFEFALLKLIGQFCHDVIGCKRHVRLNSIHQLQLVSFDPSVKFR